jgi:phospholipase/carboxylesterase
MAALETIEIETGPRPATCIIVLHGLGADGNDFVPFAQELDLAAAGPVRFIFPHAPVMPVTINNGMRMRAWYDILGRGFGTPEDDAGLRRSLAAVQELLAREKGRSMAPGRTVIAGFSQGCALALLTGLRHQERLAGIAGLSGYLPLASTTAAERSHANALTPIFMGHGQQDDVVDIERAEASRDALLALGYQVAWHDYPMAHSVCMEEVRDLNAWLLKVLAKP